MTEEQKMDLVKAGIEARQLTDALNVAYWTTDNLAVFELHSKEAHDAFTKLAALMGYEVVAK